MLTSEPEWEMVSSSAKDMAFEEFPVDDAEPPSWAARLCARKDMAIKSCSKLSRKPIQKLDGKVASLATGPEITIDGGCVGEDDVFEFPDAKELARETHCRQAGKGRHTLRAKGHCPVKKHSDVSVVAAGDAHPQDVSQLATILRQVPVHQVVKQVGGTCQEVKTREGRQAVLSGAKMYDVTVPVVGPGDDDIDVTYRVVEDGRGGTNRATRNPKCSASIQNIDATQARSKVPECAQTRKQQTCKKDIQEGMNIMGFA
ncbi:unnamed protein product [Symbiodinium natans]|uniref:Uncharacterized protein n=1 Tax=Symbiodinium natans TaxID=878477 RepID=A0A812Q1B4_9DINO|nr:unnamed protein product [Symbiodinium natans]